MPDAKRFGWRWKTRIPASVIVALALTVLGNSAIANASPDPGMVGDRAEVPGARPQWASATADEGVVDPTTEVDARIYLAGRDPRGLAAYDQSVADPGSPNLRRFLSPARMQAMFGPSPAQ